MSALFFYPRGATVITAYHIARDNTISSILENGLKASSCQATPRGEYRPKAVYMFASRRDAYDSNVRAALFGNDKDLSVIKITIQEAYFHLLREDGIFNASIICQDMSYPTGIKYLEDIPPAWIETDRP